MPIYIIPPWQSIHGFTEYSEHPRIVHGCQPIQYPLGRVSTDSPDTLDIPGLSVDANLYNTILAEYLCVNIPDTIVMQSNPFLWSTCNILLPIIQSLNSSTNKLLLCSCVVTVIYVTSIMLVTKIKYIK